MIAKAVYDILIADSNVTTDLSTYQFTTSTDTPAIFTNYKLFEDSARPAIIISETGGPVGGTRGQKGGDMGADIRVYGNRDSSDVILEDIAQAIWEALDRADGAVSGFDSRGWFADLPLKVEDTEGFPGYSVLLRVDLLKS